MKIKLLSIFWILLFAVSLSATTPVTTGYHRYGQVTARANGSPYLVVQPNAVVYVTSTSTGGGATIYSDPLLTAPIASSSVTADVNGNYSYYMPLNYCVNERIAYPGSGSVTSYNLCGNTGVINTPVALMYGGTGASTAAEGAANLVNGNPINPSSVGATTPATTLKGITVTDGTASLHAGSLTGAVNGTFSGNLAAGTTNNICIAVNQHTANAGTDIAACIATLPAASSNESYQGGGIVDATGYTGAQTIAGLAIDRPVTIFLSRGATFDVTGMIAANNIRGVTILGHATLLGDTGPGKPVIDVSGSEPVDLDVRVQPGLSNQSSIGIFESRTVTTPSPWWHHYTNTQITMPRGTLASQAANTVFTTTATTTINNQTLTPTSMADIVPFLYVQCGSNLPQGTFISGMTSTTVTLSAAPTGSGACSLVGSAGTIGFYNYGSEVNHYENITVSADRPMVFTRYNLFQVTAPNVPYYSGVTTMYSVTIDGKSDFYCDGPAMTFDGVGEDTIDIGEVSGALIPGMPMFQFTNTPNDHVNITGELENAYRLFYIPGSLVHSHIDATCQSCTVTPYSGTLTTNGTTTATLSTAGGAAKDAVVNSANVPTNTTITAINGTTVTLSAAATASSTVAATLGEPIVVLDTMWTNSGTPSGSISYTDFRIYSAAGGSTTRGNYIQGVGPAANFASSTQWSADMPAGTDLTLVSTTSNPIVAKMITIPCQVGLPGGVISPGIMAYVEDCGGPHIVGFGGTLTFPQTGTSMQLTGGEFMAPNFNPGSTPGQYNYSAATSAGQFFTNVPAGGYAIVRGPAGTAIGGGSGSSGVLVDSSGNEIVPGTLTVQGGGATLAGPVTSTANAAGGSTSTLLNPSLTVGNEQVLHLGQSAANGDTLQWRYHYIGDGNSGNYGCFDFFGSANCIIQYQYDNSVLLPALKSTTGTRYVCVDTTGKLVSQATACSGT